MHLLNKASLSDVDLHSQINLENMQGTDQLTSVPSAHFKGIHSIYNAANQNRDNFYGQNDIQDGHEQVIDMSCATEHGLEHGTEYKKY